MLIVHLLAMHTLIRCHLFSSWGQGLAATSTCGFSWTFLFTILEKVFLQTPDFSLVLEHIMTLLRYLKFLGYFFVVVVWCESCQLLNPLLCNDGLAMNFSISKLVINYTTFLAE